MKIGIDCRLWDETGVGRYIRNLVTNLDLIDKENEYVLFLLRKNLNDPRIPGRFKKVSANVKWHTFLEQFIMPLFFLKENLDILHIPYINVPIFYPKKFVLTIHDLTVLKYKTGKATTLPKPLYFLKLAGYKIALYVGMKRASRVLSVSNTTRKDIIDTFKVKPSKVVTTYNALDANFSKAASRRGKRIIPQKFILYVGNAHPHKNLETLISAFGLLGSKFADFLLVFAGRKDFFYLRLEENMPPKLKRNIRFLGYVSDKKLANLYSQASLVVIPSLYEGFGLPILEAFAYKKLVACSNIPSLKEIAGDAAVYFNPEDPKDICEKIRYALRMPAVDKAVYSHKMQLEAKVLKKYSWRKTAERTLHIYLQEFRE